MLRIHDQKKFLGNHIGHFMPQHLSFRDEIKLETQTDCAGITVPVEVLSAVC